MREVSTFRKMKVWRKDSTLHIEQMIGYSTNIISIPELFIDAFASVLVGVLESPDEDDKEGIL